MDILKGASGAWLWLPVRLYLGYQWLTAGWHKVTDPKWVETGEALLNYWKNAVRVPAPPAKPPIAYDWYRAFIQALIDGGTHTWFAKLVAFGEFLVGLALILGIATIFAAAMGALMNWAFIMAGSASTNGMMLALEFLLIFGGAAYAGYLGLDYWFRPAYRNFMDTRIWRKRTRVGTVS